MTSKKDLLVEIGCEELPPQAQLNLSPQFSESIHALLAADNIRCGKVHAYTTPRRLAVLVRDVVDRQPDQIITQRGPAVSASFDEAGKPTSAALGFARSQGVDVSELIELKTDKGAWLAYEKKRPGKRTEQRIPLIVQQALKSLTIAKRMRWGDGKHEFIRPVHWVVLLYGDDIIETKLFGIKTGRTTFGHRFHHPEAINLNAPADYEEALHAGHVLADFSKRRQQILEQANALAIKYNGQASIDDALLDEVTTLVEWPAALSGGFDTEYLDMPQEVLITTMQDNLKCFPVLNNEGRLLPCFIAISNIESSNPITVQNGFERVIRPRFSDAAFFYAQDRKHALESRQEGLKQVLFHEKLGSLHDKTSRLVVLCGSLAETMSLDKHTMQRAASLCRCDLLTKMVYEFPSLQGIMGYYYARHDGESDDVAIALKEQYLPRYADDQLPENPYGQSLALADRIDTLLGIFSIGQAPTGTRDPYGLRRAALGILRILIECRLPLDMKTLFEQAALGLSEYVDGISHIDETLDYILERLRGYYLDKGIRHDVIDAVMAIRPTSALDFDSRIHAVQQFLSRTEAQALAAANKRIHNILKKAELPADIEVQADLLKEPAEQSLAQQLALVEKTVNPLIAQSNYEQALAHLAGLRQPVDEFFDDVLVMVDDIDLRNNRLLLLNSIRNLFVSCADVSLLRH